MAMASMAMASMTDVHVPAGPREGPSDWGTCGDQRVRDPPEAPPARGLLVGGHGRSVDVKGTTVKMEQLSIQTPPLVALPALHGASLVSALTAARAALRSGAAGHIDLPPIRIAGGTLGEDLMLNAYIAVLEWLVAYEKHEESVMQWEAAKAAWNARLLSADAYQTAKEEANRADDARDAARSRVHTHNDSILCWLNQQFVQLKAGSYVWYNASEHHGMMSGVVVRRRVLRTMTSVAGEKIVEVESTGSTPAACGGESSAKPMLMGSCSSFPKIPLKVTEFVFLPSPTGSIAERTLLQAAVRGVFLSFYS
jgi:hypothetical protein